MVQEGVLLKQVIGKQAIVYKIISVQSTAVQVEEMCTISEGKMIINYRKRIGSHIYQSDVGTTYKIVKCEELNMMLDILKNTMIEVGY